MKKCKYSAWEFQAEWKIEHQKQVINRLSRKIQKRNNEIKHLDKVIGASNYSFHCLYKEKSTLVSRINKAIEYINESSGDEWEMHGDYVQNKIIEILKGGSNENN